jgi:hypothetical protein
MVIVVEAGPTRGQYGDGWVEESLLWWCPRCNANASELTTWWEHLKVENDDFILTVRINECETTIMTLEEKSGEDSRPFVSVELSASGLVDMVGMLKKVMGTNPVKRAIE